MKDANITRNDELIEFWGSGKVEFPVGLRAIGAQAFAEGSNVTEIILPKTVKWIGKQAFSGCRLLRHIHIPDGVIRIGKGAFVGCHNLESIQIPDSVKYLDTTMFIGCRKLADENGLVIVRDTLYGYFGDSKEVTIPASVTRISGSAFKGYKEITVYFDGCAKIDEDAFPEQVCFLAPNQKLKGFAVSKDKHQAVLTFFRHPEHYRNSTVTAEYRAYAAKQRKYLLEKAFTEDLADMVAACAEAGRITADNIVPEYLNPAAAAGATECVAFLMNWKGTHIAETPEQYIRRLERAILRDPYSVSEIRKQWSYRILPDDTVMLTAYKGTDDEVQIPPRVGKRPVTALDSWLMGERDDPEKEAIRQNIRAISVPEGVTSIGSFAFSYCPELEKVDIPPSVVDVGCDVFTGCPKMEVDGWIQCGHVLFRCNKTQEEVIVPDTVTVLAAEAFHYTHNIRYVFLPDSITHIGKSVFSYSFVKRVRMPSGLTHIPERMFYNSSLKTLENLPEDGWTAPRDAFEYCSNLRDPDGFWVIEGLLYEYNGSETDITVPENVTRIAPYAFCHTNIETVTIPDRVAQIGAHAFEECTELRRVMVLNDTMTIGKHIFDGCHALEDLYFPENLRIEGADVLEMQSPVEPTEGMLIAGDVLYRCYSRAKKIVVPDGVTRIGEDAFEQMEQLTEVVLPDSVTEIDDRAFYRCVHLEKINLPAGLTRIGTGAFELCWALRMVKLPVGVVRIEERTFRHCMHLHPTLSAGLTYIGAQAFEECRSMTTHRLPDGVTEIGDRAFAGCASLRAMILPEGLIHIGREAFRGCTDLASINVPVGLETVGPCAFKGCRHLADADGAVYFRNILFDHCGKADKYVIPDGVTCIGESAFSERNNLEVVVIPDSVTEIGDNAFVPCKGLREVCLSSGVQKFGKQLFNKNAGVLLRVPSGSEAVNYAVRMELPFEIRTL